MSNNTNKRTTFVGINDNLKKNKLTYSQSNKFLVKVDSNKRLLNKSGKIKQNNKDSLTQNVSISANINIGRNKFIRRNTLNTQNLNYLDKFNTYSNNYKSLIKSHSTQMLKEDKEVSMNFVKIIEKMKNVVDLINPKEKKEPRKHFLTSGESFDEEKDKLDKFLKFNKIFYEIEEINTEIHEFCERFKFNSNKLKLSMEKSFNNEENISTTMAESNLLSISAEFNSLIKTSSEKRINEYNKLFEICSENLKEVQRIYLDNFNEIENSNHHHKKCENIIMKDISSFDFSHIQCELGNRSPKNTSNQYNFNRISIDSNNCNFNTNNKRNNNKLSFSSVSSKGSLTGNQSDDELDKDNIEDDENDNCFIENRESTILKLPSSKIIQVNKPKDDFMIKQFKQEQESIVERKQKFRTTKELNLNFKHKTKLSNLNLNKNLKKYP